MFVTTPGGVGGGGAFRYSGPLISSISTATSVPGGGGVLTINGAGFSGSTSVMFGTTSATFTAHTDNRITATVPAGSGTVNIVVINGGVTSNAVQFSYSLPVVTSISPSSGPSAGGTSVALTGTGFTGATRVQFGSVDATSFTVNSDTSITALSPAGATGIVDVTVAGPVGIGPAGGKFTYADAPIVTSISPTIGSVVGGTNVTVFGDGFTDATAVKFGTTNATSFTVNSATSITASAPSAAAGAVHLTVTTPGG